MNRKYKLHPGQYEIGENEKFYGDMEARGWRLVKRGAYFSRFQPVEPSNARYRIEVFQRSTWSTEGMSEEQLGVFEDCGWEHVCTSLPLYIFRAPAGSGASKFAASFQRHLVELPSLYLLAAILLLQEFCSRARNAWIITHTYRRMKKGIPLDHSPSKKRWVHKAVNGTLLALALLCALLLAAQLITTRSTDLPEKADGPYLLLSDLGWEELRPSEEETSATHTRSLLADYWDTMERDKGKWNGDPWMYQDVYRLRDDRMAYWLAEALMKTATFGDRGENFVPIEAEGLDAAWTSWREEVVAVKGNLVAYIIYLPGTSTDFDPQTLCAALAEKWAVEP